MADDLKTPVTPAATKTTSKPDASRNKRRFWELNAETGKWEVVEKPIKAIKRVAPSEPPIPKA